MTLKGARKSSAQAKYSSDVTKYIDGFDKDVAKMMTELREIIHSADPEISETIAWHMPTFVQHGHCVHFEGFKDHLNFYCFPSAVQEFANELVNYKTTKRGVSFNYPSLLPADLIRRIVKFRVQENIDKKQSKTKKKEC